MPLDDVATKELEKLLSIPLEELALGVLNMEYYADLIGFLPWNNRRQVALTMLESVSKAGSSPDSVKEIEELFSVIAPVLREEGDVGPRPNQAPADAMDRTANLMAGLGVSPTPQLADAAASISAGGLVVFLSRWRPGRGGKRWRPGVEADSSVGSLGYRRFVRDVYGRAKPPERR